ncbi:signal transduction histidine kinase/ligand-binding sensor domain-containing protein/DNA-binding response OmpR family regulator [Parabacteroides sp. PF5-5]|uniref:hybrid sensor histidine kinase/response regulator transcription factor n=1 Tax=unclassified Parabacteroides TaxID=2649774 RepID=UPI002473AC6B|nr:MULTISPECIES: two-component regulator propeller domain-containing protein [unclassified Parabacteroides]MDH6304430.1 signal transduction histidine kinase/ligand-binding sensor domain-containing protein/DNA-binding response OmpR family regulator [Parabacteroides sp. PH5-39]MDH6315417.1 signal transduction histidine kinase/ligand-binding sensor domain-containing protein/DNA-binding response OmpR family regulator [Parabacteroides sp. PF5-13]MDH6319089.1 signal transduction histidine kinase/ligan
MRTQLLLYIFTLSLIFQSVHALDADMYKFTKIDAEKGLSDSEIKCIYKDKTGFIWFGTPSGLNRYDGYEIITYKQDLNDETSTFNNDIERIQEDADGKLWIKTRSGYSIFDTSLERFAKDGNLLLEKYSGTNDLWNSSESLLYIDLGKNFWFVTWEDIRMYDIKENKRTIFTQGGSDALSRGLIRDIRQGQNRYWFLYENGVLECMEAQSHKVISKDSTIHKAAKLKNNRDIKLFVDSTGDVWIYGIGEHYGLAHYDVAKDSWTRYSSTSPTPFRISNNVVTSIEEDEKGIIWVGNDHGGVNLIDKKNESITTLWHKEGDNNSLAQNTVKALFHDDMNIMWLGTYKQGVCYYHESIYKFNIITEKNRMPFHDINCFHEDENKNLWIGTNGGGLIYFDRKNDKYATYKHSPGNPNTPAGDVIVSMTSDLQGRLWIGYYLAGLDCFDGKTFTHYTVNPEDSEEGIPDNNIWRLRCDMASNLWVGTLNGGAAVLDVVTGKRLKTLNPQGSVYSIIETKSGNMMVGSQGGLFIYSVITDQLELFEKEIFSNIQLSRYDINNLFEDSRGLLWIGTKNGLFVYNPYTKEVRLFMKENGLSADLVQSILEDHEHNMWIATNSGLTCIHVSTAHDQPGYFYHLLSYDSSEGLQGEWFNHNAAYFTSDGELLFGGASGFNIIRPSASSSNTSPPRIVITDFQLYNKSIRPGESYNGRIILKNSIAQTKEINLDYFDNYFSLSFSSLNYYMPAKSRYFYKLEGFNDQWLETDRNNRKVTYTNLNPGKYTLYLKAVNNEGVESAEPVVLCINVRPPFWKTTWARLTYFFLLVGGGIWFFRRMTRRSEKKLAYAQENMRVTQQLEMDEMKLRFFTNISHEFRTPLTLILSPLEDLLKKAKDPEEKESLRIMRRNAKHLLTLVNQLLDFRKLDMNAHTLQKSLGDIVTFVRQQSEVFNEVMARKDINFSYTSSLKHFYMYFDADKLGKVLINLLSNAYKFTPEKGTINVHLLQTEDNKVQISITDNGEGVPEDELDKIFDRFYQTKTENSINYQGSGIGLHISKEFVLLHEGTIRAENVPEGGIRFIILLPCPKEELSTEANDTTLPVINDVEISDEDSILEEVLKSDGLPKILIIEDNKDLRTLIASRLKEHYHILQAENGTEGLAIAYKEIPDIILSDIMMPGMDGIELSKAVKGDIRTSHIPLILLTAKAGEESKLEGLKAGADDYITKPFNQEILEVKIHNLIEARKRNQTVIEEQIKIEPSKITVNSLDDKLIQKAIEYTEVNIANPDFSVEELSRELGMSRVHLYKKLLSLTGKSPIEFIRIIRLKRAAQLLQESQLTVSEIAYEVGFNNPKYFRKYFKEEFGILPSQYGSKEE